MAHFPILVRRAGAFGDSVVALRPIEPGEHLLTFKGPVLDASEYRQALGANPRGRFLQIGQDLYIGPGGGLDDYVTHSCEPNCRLRYASGGIDLVAIRPIARGAQVTFDYATSRNDARHRIRCACGAATCRGEIGNFDDLPAALKWRYNSDGMLAPWLSDYLVRRARRRFPDEPVPLRKSPRAIRKRKRVGIS